MYSKKNTTHQAGGFNSASSYSTPPTQQQYYDYYTINSAPYYGYNGYGDVSNNTSRRTVHDDPVVLKTTTSQPNTNYTQSSSSKLALPEYDYNASPEDIIHNSNANFDYERYINDWVRPYSNSNMYIKNKNANDLNGVKSYTTRENFGSLHEYYDLSPPPVNQTTSYVQPMPTPAAVKPVAVVEAAKPNPAPVKVAKVAKVAKDTKAASPTLEYLDLGIKNVLASIGAQPSANGRITIEEPVVTTAPSIFYYPVNRDYETKPAAQISILNNDFNLDAELGSDYEIIDYNQYVNLLQKNRTPTMPVLTMSDVNPSPAVPYFEQPPKQAPQLLAQPSQEVKQQQVPAENMQTIESVAPKQPPQVEDELKRNLNREIKKRVPAPSEPVVIPPTFEPAVAYPHIQFVQPAVQVVQEPAVVDYAPSQVFYNNGRVPYTVKTIQRSEPILYDPLNPDATLLLNQPKVSPPSGANVDKVLRNIEDINFKPIEDEELQLLRSGANKKSETVINKPEPVQPIKPTAQLADVKSVPARKASTDKPGVPSDDVKPAPARQDSVPASSSSSTSISTSTPGKDTKTTSPKEDKKEAGNVQPPQERIVDVKLIPTAEQSAGSRLAQTLVSSPKERNPKQPIVEEKPIALKRQESAKTQADSTEVKKSPTVKSQPSVDSVDESSDVKLPKQQKSVEQPDNDSEAELDIDIESSKQKKNSISKLIKAFEEKRDTTTPTTNSAQLKRNSSSNWNNANTASSASLADDSTRSIRRKSSELEPTSRQNSTVSSESSARRGSNGSIESDKLNLQKGELKTTSTPSESGVVKKSSSINEEEKSIPTRRIESELVSNPTESVSKMDRQLSSTKEPTSPSKLPRRKSTDVSVMSSDSTSIPRRLSVDQQATTPRRASKSSIDEDKSSTELSNKISNLIKRFESTEDDENQAPSKSPKVLEELEQIERKPSKLRNLKYRGSGDDDQEPVDVTTPPDVLSSSRIPTRSNAVRAKQSKYRSADIISELKDDIKNAELKMQQKMKNAKSDSHILDNGRGNLQSESDDNKNPDQEEEESSSTEDENNNTTTNTTSNTTATSYMSVKPKRSTTTTVSSKINATTTTTTTTNGAGSAADTGSVSSFSISSKAQVTDKQNVPQSKVELKRKSDKPI